MNKYRCNNLKNGARLGEIECNADDYAGKNCEKATRGVISPLCWGCSSISDLLDENGEPIFCVCGLTNEQCDEKNEWIKQEAREKMLDELINKVIDSVPSPIIWVSFNKLQKIINELRQNKQVEK